MLGADRAAGAIWQHAICEQPGAFAGRAPSLEVGFVFVAEIPQCCQDGVGRGLAEAAQAALLDFAGEPFEFGEAFAPALAGDDSL